ncbi:hypothetical protein LTR66_004801 [Elasticomyces elasticus]|nr:hypothetical protein LTR66_004801 [Elasticomyces elasticus]
MARVKSGMRGVYKCLYGCTAPMKTPYSLRLHMMRLAAFMASFLRVHQFIIVANATDALPEGVVGTDTKLSRVERADTWALEEDGTPSPEVFQPLENSAKAGDMVEQEEVASEQRTPSPEAFQALKVAAEAGDLTEPEEVASVEQDNPSLEAFQPLEEEADAGDVTEQEELATTESQQVEGLFSATSFEPDDGDVLVGIGLYDTGPLFDTGLATQMNQLPLQMQYSMPMVADTGFASQMSQFPLPLQYSTPTAASAYTDFEISLSHIPVPMQFSTPTGRSAYTGLPTPMSQYTVPMQNSMPMAASAYTDFETPMSQVPVPLQYSTPMAAPAYIDSSIPMSQFSLPMQYSTPTEASADISTLNQMGQIPLLMQYSTPTVAPAVYSETPTALQMHHTDWNAANADREDSTFAVPTHFVLPSQHDPEPNALAWENQAAQQDFDVSHTQQLQHSHLVDAQYTPQMTPSTPYVLP